MAKKKANPSVATATAPKVDYLLMFYPDGASIASDDVPKVIEELGKSKRPSRRKLVLVLNSRGGNPFAAVKMVRLMRQKYKTLITVVPYWANSAATLMSLASDEIVMAVQSELGPLDLPYEHPSLSGQSISTNDVITSSQNMFSTARELAVQYAEAFRGNQDLGVDRVEALSHGCKLAADVMRPLLEKEDPRVISLCARRLSIAEIYAKGLLADFMFREAMSYNRQGALTRVSGIVQKLIWKYPDHGFAILRDDAKSTGLRIKHAETSPYWDDAWQLYSIYGGSQKKVIRLIDGTKLVKP